MKIKTIIFFCIALFFIIHGNSNSVFAQQNSSIKTSNQDSLGIDEGLLALIKEYRDLVLSGKTELAANKKKIILELGNSAYPNLKTEINNLLDGKPARSQPAGNNGGSSAGQSSNSNTSNNSGNYSGQVSKTKQPGGSPPPAGKPGTPSIGRKNVDAVDIPDYNKNSIPLLFKAGYSGIYIAFINGIRPKMTTAPKENYVYKFYGFNNWVKSVQSRFLSYVFPLDHENTAPEELSYYWAGQMSMDDITKFGKNPPQGGLNTGLMYGLYSLPGRALTYWPPIPAFLGIAADHSSRPLLWFVGPSALNNFQGIPQSNAPHLYVVPPQASDNHKYIEINKPLSNSNSPGQVIMEPVKDDRYMWIGIGTEVTKASSSGDFLKIDLAKYGATGYISKIAVVDDLKDDFIWVLCGSDIFKIYGSNVEKYYTIKSAIPSFAATGYTLYCNDGNKVSSLPKKVESFLGNGPFMENQRHVYDEIVAEIGNCKLEVLKSSTSFLIYLFSHSKGKIYTINSN